MLESEYVLSQPGYLTWISALDVESTLLTSLSDFSFNMESSATLFNEMNYSHLRSTHQSTSYPHCLG